MKLKLGVKVQMEGESGLVEVQADTKHWKVQGVMKNCWAVKVKVKVDKTNRKQTEL